MSIMKREELRNQLSRREFAPVYVLFGSERRMRDLAVDTITKLAFGEDDLRDFNESEFSLNTDGNLQNALAAAAQLPMMAARRVVKIRDVRISASGHRDTLREEHESLLASYLTNPCESAIVIFVADELNGVRKIGKLLRSDALAVEFAPLDDAEMVQSARKKFKEEKVAIDETTLRHLVSLAGNDLSRLENETEKLTTASLPGLSVTIDLVEALVPNTRELSNFDLTDNLVRKNKVGALKVLKKILDDGAEPVMILGLISYNFRRLLMAKDMMVRGVERGEIARMLNLRYRDQEGFLAAARRTSLDSLGHVLKRIAETDLAIKMSIGGGTQAGRMQIEMLVCELAMKC